MRRTVPLLVLAAAAVVGVVVWTREPAGPPPPAAKPAPPPPLAAAPAEAAPVRPTRPPGPDDKHPRPAEPARPIVSDEWKREVSARVAGSANPGELAFRAFSDLFVDQNLGFAERQAAAEGITVGEVRELTHFGLLVLATQRVPEVEELLGRELTAEEREGLAELMQAHNDRFKQAMRALVARGAPEAERRQLIRDTDAAYRKELFAVTGMTAELLDDLLAGDLLLPGAPGRLEPPSGTAVEGPKDDVADPPRPAK